MKFVCAMCGQVREQESAVVSTTAGQVCDDCCQAMNGDIEEGDNANADKDIQ